MLLSCQVGTWEAAQRLGIPPTHIYFAVDFDATDDQVTSNILPYFRAVLANLGGGYKVGIYASRNICTRVIEAGYAGYAFVSDHVHRVLRQSGGSRSQIIGYMTSSLKSVVIRDKAGILTALPIPAKCLLYPM